MRVADLILAIVLCAVAGWMMSCMDESAASRPDAVETVREPALQRLLSEVTARLPERARVTTVQPAEHRLHPESIPFIAAIRPSGDNQC